MDEWVRDCRLRKFFPYPAPYFKPPQKYIAPFTMPPKSDDPEGILEIYQSCLESFTGLLRLLRKSEPRSVVPFVNQLGRFNVWVENAGAHRSGRVSLDYRLREASEIKEMVIELLDNLNCDLQDGE